MNWFDELGGEVEESGRGLPGNRYDKQALDDELGLGGEPLGSGTGIPYPGQSPELDSGVDPGLGYESDGSIGMEAQENPTLNYRRGGGALNNMPREDYQEDPLQPQGPLDPDEEPITYLDMDDPRLLTPKKKAIEAINALDLTPPNTPVEKKSESILQIIDGLLGGEDVLTPAEKAGDSKPADGGWLGVILSSLAVGIGVATDSSGMVAAGLGANAAQKSLMDEQRVNRLKEAEAVRAKSLNKTKQRDELVKVAAVNEMKKRFDKDNRSEKLDRLVAMNVPKEKAEIVMLSGEIGVPLKDLFGESGKKTDVSTAETDAKIYQAEYDRALADSPESMPEPDRIRNAKLAASRAVENFRGTRAKLGAGGGNKAPNIVRWMFTPTADGSTTGAKVESGASKLAAAISSGKVTLDEATSDATTPVKKELLNRAIDLLYK